MKNLVLAVMTMMTMVGPANATNAWDQFWGTDLPTTAALVGNALDPVNSGWDQFFGTTLDPQNTGWDDFWHSCQDETKTAGDCVATVITGIGAIIAAPLVIASGIAGVAVGVVATAGAVTAPVTIAGIPIAIVTVGPVMVF